MKANELIGNFISNTGDKPSMKITDVLPANNIGHFRTNYNYVVQLNDREEKHTVESLNTPSMPKVVQFEK